MRFHRILQGHGSELNISHQEEAPEMQFAGAFPYLSYKTLVSGNTPLRNFDVVFLFEAFGQHERYGVSFACPADNADSFQIRQLFPSHLLPYIKMSGYFGKRCVA